MRYTYDAKQGAAKAEYVLVQENPDVITRDSTPPTAVARSVGALSVTPSGREVNASRDVAAAPLRVPEDIADRLRAESERTGRPASVDVSYRYTHDVDEQRTTVSAGAPQRGLAPKAEADRRRAARLAAKSGGNDAQVGQAPAGSSGNAGTMEAGRSGLVDKAEADRRRANRTGGNGNGGRGQPGQPGQRGQQRPAGNAGNAGTMAAGRGGLASKADAEERRRQRREQGGIVDGPEHSPAKPRKFTSKKRKNEPRRSPGRTTVVVQSSHGGNAGSSRPQHFRSA